ncbi:MAG: ATP-binding protein [Chloroflexota bacterium]
MNFLTNLTIGKKITLLTSIGLVFGVAAFSSLGLRAVNQATETMLQDRLTTAQLLADYVDEVLGRATTELYTTAQGMGAEEPVGNIAPRIEALMTTYSHLPIHTYGIYLFDSAGGVIWSDPAMPGTAPNDIPAYLGIRQVNDGPSVSGLVSLPTLNAPVILLSSPTGGSPDSDRGTIVIAVDIAESSIGGFIQPVRLGQTGYVEIVDQNGVVVARTNPGPRLAPFEQSDHSGRFAALIAAGEPARGVCHTCHEANQRVEKRDVLAFVPLSTAPWGVVVRQAEEEALAPSRELRQSLLLFGVGLVTVALAFVFVTTRDVGSRIRTLTTASRKIAEGDLVSPVSTLGRDEVGILAQTLDDMRVKLKTSYVELEQKTKEAEQARALQEADRLRSEFISSVSHELRTPLTLIKGYSTSLLRENVKWDPDSQREFLQIIDDKTDELRDLIDKLLQSAKLEAGALKLEKEPVLLPRLVEKVVEDLTSRGKNHRFTLEFPTPFPVVEADARAVEQVLRNLVENAIKYSPQDTEIIIGGEVKDGQVIVQVSDSGRGIPEEHQKRVFERFYRGDSAMTQGIHGSGLGLFISRGHVEAHGGSIWLESGPGTGSRFFFCLPLGEDIRRDED